jgi:hypothetical protein
MRFVENKNAIHQEVYTLIPVKDDADHGGHFTIGIR